MVHLHCLCRTRLSLFMIARITRLNTAPPRLTARKHISTVGISVNRNFTRPLSYKRAFLSPVACRAAQQSMALRTLSPKDAAALDEDLMSDGAFSIDQLMELAGLAVSQAVFKLMPPEQGTRVLVACGPGNNGGDGLVAARHLWHYGYKPTIYYPKQSKNDLYQRLATQLKTLSIPFTTDLPTAMQATDLVVDAIFGFSFSGAVRDPFPAAIACLRDSSVPVLSVDAPSSWNIDEGAPKEGPGKGFQPDALISLTAPKPLVKFFRGRHFVGGRFLSDAMAEKYGLDVPKYQGVDQIVEVPVGEQKL